MVECREKGNWRIDENYNNALVSTDGISAEESMPKLSLQVQHPMASTFASYPERVDEPDCPYYMRTGLCGYGMNCRFNHPPDMKQAARSKGEFPERIGQPECQYYLKTGTCKYGATCKYHHPHDKIGFGGQLQLNCLGLPIREGEKDCAYYMRTGSCKYGINCRFHHPHPAALGTMMPFSGYVSAGSPVAPAPGAPYLPGLLSWSLPRAPYVSGPVSQGSPSYMPVIFSPSQGMLSMSGWSSYQGPISPLLSPEMQQQPLGTGLGYSSRKKNDSPPSGMQGVLTTFVDLGPAAMGFSKVHSQSSVTHTETFPERPGQPECQYYLKTGNCKFGTTCRYHHPKEKVADSVTCMLSPIGLPLRPDQPACAFYSRYGICKFGPTCKFDHPLAGLSYSPSASSLSDLPVVPYPRSGSPTTTLVRSSSSEKSQAVLKPKDQPSRSESTSFKHISTTEGSGDTSQAEALGSLVISPSAESCSG